MAAMRAAPSWLLAVVFSGLGITLGLFAPRWFGSLAARQHPPDVISQVRELARLEGVSYHMERVVDLKEETRSLFGLMPAGDAILLVASGDVVAGVDLGRLGPSDVTRAPDGRSVSIVLPRAEVFSARLDNAHTYVHSRKTDLFAQRQESLETRARQAAEQTLKAAAEEAGILERAEDSVARTVTSLVRSLGFERVRVEYGPRS
jgi:hypothetical protein